MSSRATILYMDRKAFHQLLKRYAEGTCSQAERELIDRWYELLDDESLSSADPILDPEVEARLWVNIRDKVRSGAAPVLPLSSRRKRLIGWAVAAAVVVLISGLGIYVYKSREPVPRNILQQAELNLPLKDRTNGGAASQELVLEDGSRVVLGPGAHLTFPEHFGNNKREVYLEGTAFFSIAKNTSKPFFVYNEHVVTQVLGTSFTIKTDKEKVEVEVKTGRVAVYESGDLSTHADGHREADGVIITPNQKVTYYAIDRHFVTALVDTPMAVAAESGEKEKIRFVFEDAPLSQVLDNLGKAYNIQISVENENLYHCPFTGDIGGQSLYEKLELICQSIGATYEIKGTAILIKGKGCN